MKLTKYNTEDYIKLTHKRFKCYFTVVKRNVGGKTANSVSFPNLTYTKINSEMLTSEAAKIIGEMFLEISKIIKD
ncbi:hypothetical protein [Desulfonauticus submarinus]